MTVKNKLRNNLIRKLHQLSFDKLVELDNLLDDGDRHPKSKENTLKLAGAWKDLDDNFFTELTEELHSRRANDREII